MILRHPPGRAGRLWLVERLAVARRAADVLDRRRRVLLREERRLAHLVSRTGEAWTEAVRHAETWQRRAMVLGGRPALAATASVVGPATARLVWRTEMGVAFAAEAGCDLAAPPGVPGTAALTEATDAYRRALDRAVEHAAATDAHERFSRELAATERRLHAVRERWMPQLETALTELQISLDEHEREELVRTRLHRVDARAGEPR